MRINYLNAFFQITRHEIKIMFRSTFSWITPVVFYVMVVCLFPLAIGHDQELLNSIAPGIIWVAALLATIISMGNLFRNDFEEGYLDLLLVSTYPLSLIALTKITSHWITHGLPLILISPLLGLLLNLSRAEHCALIFTLLLGTPVLSLIGAIGAALTVAIRGNEFLLPMLIIPFYIPILIFGTGIMLMTHNNEPVSAYYAMMGALVLLSLVFAPLLTGQALKIGANG
jgi:heme exporter protein B